ncbi:hypothetical protein GCM10011519_02030 [Marmoricola endophyticus]|uniref:Secreted protein n=1 Tax=Marmoricola endophyticus TaxID=2040280 RepID=A0A917EXV8_9ACTN|nr:hypothetical protein [Marmoricola endophyticus]GGF32234.1 hypothetical protein GCM10011519_02030 [Marmoricola endophyticus]
MRTRRTPLALAAAGVLALLAPTAPALAARHTTVDRQHDVQHVETSFDDASGPAPAVDPAQAEGDVTALRVVHGPHRVRMVMQYAALSRPSGSQDAFHAFRLKTPGHRYYDLFLDAHRGRPQGERDFSHAYRFSPVRCKGLRTHIDYARDSVTASIPRSCLGNPRWVRVGGAAATFAVDVDAETFSGYLDDASLPGQLRDYIKLGPRVRRG